MREIPLHTSKITEIAPALNAGDRVLLSGTIYTARDAAHKRIFVPCWMRGRSRLSLWRAPASTTPAQRRLRKGCLSAPVGRLPAAVWTCLRPVCWIWE